MYDPTVGRFLEEDPIGFEGVDANTSRYVGNNATNATDAMGLASEPAATTGWVRMVDPRSVITVDGKQGDRKTRGKILIELRVEVYGPEATSVNGRIVLSIRKGPDWKGGWSMADALAYNQPNKDNVCEQFLLVLADEGPRGRFDNALHDPTWGTPPAQYKGSGDGTEATTELPIVINGSASQDSGDVQLWLWHSDCIDNGLRGKRGSSTWKAYPLLMAGFRIHWGYSNGTFTATITPDAELPIGDPKKIREHTNIDFNKLIRTVEFN